MAVPKKLTENQEKEICRIYFIEKLTLHQIANIYRCSYTVIRNAICNQGFKPRNRSEAQKRKRPDLLGKLNPHWRGGKITCPDGYIRRYKPTHPNRDCQGYVFEHRLIMEKHLGRYLTPKEVVHHINENRADNRIQNLMFFANVGFHCQHHNLKRGVLRKEKNEIKVSGD